VVSAETLTVQSLTQYYLQYARECWSDSGLVKYKIGVEDVTLPEGYKAIPVYGHRQETLRGFIQYLKRQGIVSITPSQQNSDRDSLANGQIALIGGVAFALADFQSADGENSKLAETSIQGKSMSDSLSAGRVVLFGGIVIPSIELTNNGTSNSSTGTGYGLRAEYCSFLRSGIVMSLSVSFALNSVSNVQSTSKYSSITSMAGFGFYSLLGREIIMQARGEAGALFSKNRYSGDVASPTQPDGNGMVFDLTHSSTGFAYGFHVEMVMNDKFVFSVNYIRARPSYILAENQHLTGILEIMAGISF